MIFLQKLQRNEHAVFPGRNCQSGDKGIDGLAANHKDA